MERKLDYIGSVTAEYGKTLREKMVLLIYGTNKKS